MLGFCAGDLENASTDRGLSGCLSGDAQGGTDLAPRGSVAPGCIGHQKSCPAQGLMGVSQGVEVVQRPLRAPVDGSEHLDGLTGFPARLSAFLGAHRSERKPTLPHRTFVPDIRHETTLATANDCKHPISEIGGVGAPNGCSMLIGSCMSPRTREMGAATTANEWPRATAIAGAVDGSGASDADDSSLR